MVERRLAAVLAADMVGYSRLMEVDEAGTLARLSRNERIAVIKEAMVIIVTEDLGFSGPLWGEIIRLLVDLLGDAIDDLFRKRGLIAAA